MKIQLVWLFVFAAILRGGAQKSAVITKNFKFKDLVKLEECFILFHRHTRFFMGDKYNSTNGHLSEFQQGFYMLNLGLFKSEINLAEFMFVNGEFYFLNVNFL